MKTAAPPIEFFQGVLDHISQGILLIDPQGLIICCNKSAEQILGIKETDILYQAFWNFFEDTAFGFSLRQALKKKSNHAAFATYTSPDNTHSELDIISTFVPNQGIILILKDLTEMRHLQGIISRTSRMKELGEMAAHVAHEIRNPLGGIKGFASLLKRDLADSPKLQQMADYIVEGTDNLNNLVNQVLHYSRPFHPKLEIHDLISILQEIRTHVLADENIEKEQIDIDIVSTIKTLPIAIDLSMLKSAILNLVVNATQAVKKQGKITIKIEKSRRHAAISIIDNGMGITEENIAKLYSPFFTTKPDGNGLGLPEVQKVVQAHGGTIDVESTVGQGTAFTIKLPLLHTIKGKNEHR